MPDLSITIFTPPDQRFAQNGARYWQGSVAPSSAIDDDAAMLQLKGLAGYSELALTLTAPTGYLADDLPVVTLVAELDGGVIEIENQNDIPYGQYFYIDYELCREPQGDDTAYFHAQWTRENPADGWGPGLQTNSPETNVVQLSGEGNYCLLEAEGRGHYIGCNLSVAHFQGSWWGEGDDMIFIDEDTWPPSLHGTGTEDYFNHAWGMQANKFPLNGSILHESEMPGY